MNHPRRVALNAAGYLFLAATLPSSRAAESSSPMATGDFVWASTGPMVSPAQRPADPCYSIKDPTVVRYENRWHLFCTIRSVKRSHQIEYLSFDDWTNANKAARHILAITNGYFCAPQIFYFTSHRMWYLIYQASDTNRPVALQPAFSTSTNIADPTSWTTPVFLYDRHPANIKGWIDFWVICDGTKAHLFFTSNNGLMWRAETKFADFPRGWSEPAIVLRDDIFEASHTYKLKGQNEYLTVIEAIGNQGRRYYKAYLANRLDGEWKPLAASREKPFASTLNTRFAGAPWADSISHGEMIRAGYDERLEIDATDRVFLYQGVSDKDRAGKKYGEIPWQLGLLKPTR
jgi:Glycosyl hydrolase family 62